MTSASYCSQNLLWTGDVQRVVTLGYSAKKYAQLGLASLGVDSAFKDETLPTIDELQWGLAGTLAGRDFYLRRNIVDPFSAWTDSKKE